jgi:phospholipid transport system substrate-binding protein
MTAFRRVVPAVAVLLLAGPASQASAGPPTDQLKVQIDRVLRVVENPEYKKQGKQRDRRAAVRQIASEIFDFGETARRSLGRHWQARTPAERQQFVTLFTDLLERSYISKIELYGGERIAYNGDTVDGEVAFVRTRLTTKQGTDIPIEYRMLRRGDRWMVYDVVIEGISLIANYRTQFNKIIQTSSYEELVRRMKDKQEEFEAAHGIEPKRL